MKHNKDMDRRMYVLALMMVSACLPQDSGSAGQDMMPQEVIISEAFSHVDSLLAIDNGTCWDHQLYGPLLIVDPDTRAFVANENNASNTFKKIHTVFSDTLPNDINIANTALNWENKRWSMVMLPLPQGEMARSDLLIHELFHRIQPEIGFENMKEADNGHLDTYMGRLLLTLELQALTKALSAENDSLRKRHLTNALIFRVSRQSNEQEKDAENALEINEGLAEYTAVILSGRNEQEMRSHLIQSVHQFYDNPTFVRSFAYQTTPIYGYLLSRQKSLWQREITSHTNLTDFFIRSFAINPASNKSVEQIARENDYGYQEIAAKEQARENERLATLSAYKKRFLEEPVLKIYFENMNISFDPRNIVPLEKLGTVYPQLRVIDNFGILTVENGALLSADWSNVIVTAPTEMNGEIVKGDGWTLELQQDWKVEKANGLFELKKK